MKNIIRSICIFIAATFSLITLASSNHTDFIASAGLGKSTAVAENNFVKSLNQINQKEFRWQTPSGTRLVLTRLQNEGKPAGFTDCNFKDSLYEGVGVLVTAPEKGEEYYYFLCKNGFSTVYTSISEVTYDNGKKFQLVVTQVFNLKQKNIKFSVVTLDPVTRKSPYSCEVLLDQFTHQIEKGGYMENTNCSNILEWGFSNAIKFGKSLEGQSVQLFNYLSASNPNTN